MPTMEMVVIGSEIRESYQLVSPWITTITASPEKKNILKQKPVLQKS